MTDIYDREINEMKARERPVQARNMRIWANRDKVANARNTERLAAYKRKRAMVEIQRLGQEWDNG